MMHFRSASQLNFSLCFVFILRKKRRFCTCKLMEMGGVYVQCIARAASLLYICTHFSQKSISDIASKLFITVELHFISKNSFCKSLERISLFRRKGFLVIFYSKSSVSLKSKKERPNSCFKNSR